MCGRFALPNPSRLIVLPLGVDIPVDLEARYNIAPASTVPLVVESRSGRRFEKARWGLVPFWADDPSIGNRLANARADGVATKPSFRNAFRQRRGLMPAGLYYEWQAIPGQKRKQPWCIGLADREPFVMAALWERWTPKDQPDAEPLVTCCIITTDANDATRAIHDRMPVIIAPGDIAQWLDPATTGADAQSLLRPYDGAMDMWPVSTRVNTARVDDASLIAPLDSRAATSDDPPTLFQ